LSLFLPGIAVLLSKHVRVIETLMAKSEPHVTVIGAGRYRVRVQKDSRCPLIQRFLLVFISDEQVGV